MPRHRPSLSALLVAASSVVLTGSAFSLSADTVVAESRPNDLVWDDANWPFPIDEWGIGKAFHCRPAECGVAADLYLRAKIGFCNCVAGVEDDAELDRLSDFELLGGKVMPLGEGRPVLVYNMKGRSRAFLVTGRRQHMISIAFSSECDALVATVVYVGGDEDTIHNHALEALDGAPALAWVKAELGH